MAKKEKKKEPFDYRAAKKTLTELGPARAYLLHGEEDYLRDSFLAELKMLCVAEGTEAFNYHRLTGPAPDLPALREAVEAMPFLSERTLVEVRDLDINKLTQDDSSELRAIVSDLPEWVTLAFVFAPGYAPDMRLGVCKAVAKAGKDLEFTAPPESQLVAWAQKRAAAAGKRLDRGNAAYLLWVCGRRMNTLQPEILKIAGAAEGEEITRADIDAVAKRDPETTVYNMTDALGAKNYDKAAELLADLLADRDEPPQKQIVMVSDQLRRLYIVRLAQERRLGDDYIADCLPDLAGRSYPLKLAKESAARFSRRRLARAVLLCAECEFGMRDGADAEKQMKDLILRLALDDA